jgi:hypothetical protein
MNLRVVESNPFDTLSRGYEEMKSGGRKAKEGEDKSKEFKDILDDLYPHCLGLKDYVRDNGYIPDAIGRFSTELDRQREIYRRLNDIWPHVDKETKEVYRTKFVNAGHELRNLKNWLDTLNPIYENILTSIANITREIDLVDNIIEAYGFDDAQQVEIITDELIGIHASLVELMTRQLAYDAFRNLTHELGMTQNLVNDFRALYILYHQETGRYLPGIGPTERGQGRPKKCGKLVILDGGVRDDGITTEEEELSSSDEEEEEEEEPTDDELHEILLQLEVIDEWLSIYMNNEEIPGEGYTFFELDIGMRRSLFNDLREAFEDLVDENPNILGPFNIIEGFVNEDGVPVGDQILDLNESIRDQLRQLETELNSRRRRRGGKRGSSKSKTKKIRKHVSVRHTKKSKKVI